MSIEIVEDEIQKSKRNSGFGSGASIHEHSSAMLLFPHITDIEEQEDGKTVHKKTVDVDARTRLPQPANTGVLEYYGEYYLDKAFGKGRGRGMRYINGRYKINMISKDGKSRSEYENIATAGALNQTEDSKGLSLRKVQES